MNTVTMLVTPEIASEWLEKNTRNRNLNNKSVDALAKLMVDGKWLLTHQGIAFSPDGVLLDGQHRLAAICKSGISQTMQVTFGLKEETRMVIDSLLQPRKDWQTIGMKEGFSWFGKDHSAVVKIFDKIITGRGTAIKYSNYDIEQIAKKYQSSIRFCVEGTKKGKKNFTAPIKAAIGAAYRHENSLRLIKFHEVYTTGFQEDVEDRAAIVLRNWVLNNEGIAKGSLKTLELVRGTMYTIKSFCDRKPIRRMMFPDHYIYLPIPDDGTEHHSS